MSAMRLLLDEDVPILLAQVLRARAVDVVHATEVGMTSFVDPRVFARSLSEGRTMMSHNIGDFATLAANWIRDGNHHGGLILSPQRKFGELLGRTMRFINERQGDDLTDAVIWI